MGEDGWDGVLEHRDNGYTILHLHPTQNTDLSTPVGGLILKGWIVIDKDGALWFFPGEDNEPEKVNDEWIGFNPIMVEEKPEYAPGFLRNKPTQVIFKSI